MTADEYTILRQQLDLTQGQLASRLGVSIRTINGRESGAYPIDKEAEIAIRHLALKHQIVEESASV